MSSTLWVDRYRPTRLEQLNFHSEIDEALKSLSRSDDMPHLLFSGPRGCGKMTRIRSLLCSLFDPTVLKLKIDDKAFQTPSGRKIDITVFSSNFHVEINPSHVGIYDRIVVQEIIQELAQTRQLDKSKNIFKVAIILEADKLSRDAQQALRRTMERYSSNLRMILCCSSSSPIIDPIQSRCLILRIPAPSNFRIESAIKETLTAENAHINDEDLSKIISSCEGNARRALLSCESAVVRHGIPHDKTDWEKYVNDIVNQILREKSPAALLSIRAKLYDLLTHSIPAQLIIKTILFDLLCLINDSISLGKIIEAAAFYDHRVVKGNKAIFHLEAFVAKIMAILLSHQQ